MGTSERRTDRAARRAHRILADAGEELRRARLEHGLSQAAVATAARTTQCRISLIERGMLPSVSVPELCLVLAVVARDFAAQAYPAGRAVRDAPHIALIARFRSAVPHCPMKTEVPIPLPGDARAWDIVAGTRPHRTGIEAETKLADVQSLERRVALKLNDDPTVERAALLIANTRRNREILRAVGSSLRASFPLDSAQVLAALAADQPLEANGIVLL